LIHANRTPTGDGRSAFIRSKPTGGGGRRFATSRRRRYINRTTNLNNFMPIAWSRTGDGSFKCLPYQLSMVGYAPTMVVTGNGESGFDSGEGA
ncbi:hypothetical protein RN001_012545, partial [Aquatica leii]